MSHPVSVYAEMTPNPEVMKFVADRALIEGNAQAEFTSKAECAGHSSLAEELFNFPFVAGVFISGNFVSVTKDDTIGWEMIDPAHRVFVSPSSGLRDVVPAVGAGRVGAVAVLEHDQGEILGIVTDGDLRRALERDPSEWASLTAKDVMQPRPKCLTPDTLAAVALDSIESARISQIVVQNQDGHFVGFVHLHQLIDAGIR